LNGNSITQKTPIIMHHAKKKAAVDKYSNLKSKPDELRLALEADEKGYTPEEVEEVITAIVGEPPVTQPQVFPSLLNDYELWAVDVTYKKEFDENMNVIQVVDEIKKKGYGPLRTTRIEPRHAATLNEPVNDPSNPNKQYYFLKD
jgi:hypothetical protein